MSRGGKGISAAVAARGERVLAPKAIVPFAGSKRRFDSDSEDEGVEVARDSGTASRPDKAKEDEPKEWWEQSDSDDDVDEAGESKDGLGKDSEEDPETGEVDASNDGLNTQTPEVTRRPRAKKKKKRREDDTAGLPSFLASPVYIPSEITHTPLDDLSLHLNPHLVELIKKNRQIQSLFPVQAVSIPHILKESGEDQFRDVLISAPTGSGKTLAYILPVLSTLMTRVVTRIRCLVVLPTRELARQVRDEFERLARGTGLKIGLATSGSGKPLSTEASRLIDVEAGHDNVDILIATPGRLVEHVQSTPSFTLQHLRFLVVDEADGLLKDEFRSWLDVVFDSAERQGDRVYVENMERLFSANNSKDSFWAKLGIRTHPVWTSTPLHTAITIRRDYSLDPDLPLHPKISYRPTPLQKILCSATLTRNPSKLALLNLKDPVLVSVKGDAMPLDARDIQPDSDGTEVEGRTSRYAVPATLSEKAIHVDSIGDKPMVLLHLLFNEKLSGVLMFSRSAETAARLARLVELVSASTGDSNVSASFLSSALTAQQRRTVLRSFSTGKTTALICTDLASRGLDLGPSVSHVINYDPPSDLKNYIHRVGRTARAGNQGTGWSVLLQGKETGFFGGMMEMEGREGRVKRVRVKKENGIGWDALRKMYAAALERLGKEVKGVPVDKKADVVDAMDVDAAEAMGEDISHVGESDEEEEEQPVEDLESGTSSSSSETSSSSSDSEDSSDELEPAPQPASSRPASTADPELVSILKQGFADLKLVLEQRRTRMDEECKRKEAERVDAEKAEREKMEERREKLRLFGAEGFLG